MRFRGLVLVLGVVVVVIALFLVFLYPYMTFKPPEFVSASWGISSQSSLVSVVLYFNLWLENPNPYAISIISSSITVSYNNGVTLSLQPEYLPVELMPHSVNVTAYTGSISLSQAAQFILSPPTSYVVTWQAIIQTPLGTKTVTCTATTYIPTNQTTQTCTS
ncbi:hypothetical protein [Vulcanisaeta distributa]|uniref:Uncharacterized protein n=1 Tax=Vulcanisaeta distributa (strain DSM 14429 / JCM 11212 / NBRC 100878 / IC-017) TaxID=572478 RepID=E1QRF4_VULDI|nr:hypothetical protein [Vulcanisaeta distributa]ADN50651.1 hypothetical protein Vdis_1265 [Vulcanisaeta distributa DSM 14429]